MQNRDIFAVLRERYAEYTTRSSDSTRSQFVRDYFDGKAMGIAEAIQLLIDMSPD